MATGGTTCHFFNTPRGCWNGDNCRFVHSQPEGGLPPCRFFSLPSGCRFGDKCFFSHSDPEPANKVEVEPVGVDWVVQDLGKMSIAGALRHKKKPEKPVLQVDIQDFRPDLCSMEPYVSSLVFTGQLKYDCPILDQTKWKHGSLAFHHDNEWTMELYFDCVSHEKPIFTVNLDKTTLKKVVFKESGVTICCDYEDSDLTIHYRPSAVENVHPIYAVFSDVAEGTQKKGIKKGGHIHKHGDHSDSDDDDEDDNDDDDEDDEDDVNYFVDYSSDDDDDDDDMFERATKDRWATWRKTVVEDTRTPPELDLVHCGICKEVFEGDKTFDKLKDHYFQKFLKHDTIHTRYTHDAPQFRDGTECVVCGKYFGHCGSLVRHTMDKCRREDTDGENHREMAIKGIVEPMCYYDVDHHNKQTLRSELAQTLVQESFQDKLLEDIGFSLRVHEALGLGCRHFGDSDSDSDDYFNSDEFELACQFIKPWEVLGL